MLKTLTRPVALLAICALAACGGGGSTTPATTLPPSPGTATLTTIVGIGDSLTAGEQADGLLGVPTTSPVSILPGNFVPPTQENGFFALLLEQAKGLSAATMANPATSLLPLINAPGLYAQLVPSAQLFSATHSPCDQFNQAAYQLSTAMSVVRANPSATTYDVAVPSQTAHEALYMTAPITGPSSQPNCGYPSNPYDPTAGGLQSLVTGESATFYPMLGGFAGKIPNLDQVDAAVSLHPTLATVWLGANDLLKFIFSGGNPVATDSPQQMQTDIAATITKLHNAGSQVIVANLPDVLDTPQFFTGGAALAQSFTIFSGGRITPTQAAQLSGYIAQTYGVTAAGALTESGFFTALGQLGAGAPVPNLDPAGKGSGVGSLYIPDALDAQARALNGAYNQAIAAAAQATGTPLLDIHQIFVQIKNNQYAPAFVNPPKCCGLQFGGGIVSFDGLHPSSTGYALVANAFIAAINSNFGTAIPALTQAQIQAIYATDVYAPH